MRYIVFSTLGFWPEHHYYLACTSGKNPKDYIKAVRTLDYVSRRRSGEFTEFAGPEDILVTSWTFENEPEKTEQFGVITSNMALDYIVAAIGGYKEAKRETWPSNDSYTTSEHLIPWENIMN